MPKNTAAYKTIIISIGLFFLTSTCFAAANTYDWVGTSSTSWTTPQNWRLNNATQTAAGSYPGKTVATDIVDIGVNYTYSSSKEPLITATPPNNIASITFGIINGSSNDVSLTVTSPATLTVTGNITFNHGAGSNNSKTTYTTDLIGTGAIVCNGTLQIGNNTAPTTKAVNTTQVSSQINHLTIVGNMLFYAVGNNSTTATNYPSFDLDNGQVTLNGQFTATSVNGPNNTADVYAWGRFNSGTTNNSVTLELTNNQAVDNSFTTNYIVDFIYSAGNNGTVLYDSPSGSQIVYTTADARIGANPDVYYYLTFAGASTKVPEGPNLTVEQDWNSSSGNIDLLSNNTSVSVGDDWTNSSTVTQGSGDIDVNDDVTNSGPLNLGSGAFNIGGNWVNSGVVAQSYGNISVSGNVTNSGILGLGTGSLTITGNYTNAGTYTASTGYTVFNGNKQVLTDSGFGTMFNYVVFNGNGGSSNTAKINSGNFSVSTIGILTMQNATYLNANGHLTLNSDVNSSASVAAIPAGAGITGNVSVQRFIQGSSTSLLKRGYRLIASTVYTGTVGGVNMFDLKYLLNSTLVTGLNGTTYGFSASPLNNPTLYLFREDDPPPPSNATNFRLQYNWKGISRINNTNNYDIGIQKRNDITNLNDTTVNIPAGNGVLFYFRGDNTHNLVNKTVTPYAYPEDVTTTQVGTLNTGTVNVKMWFGGGLNNLGYNFSYTPGYVNSGTAYLRGGYACLGNPYAATINWETYNRNATANKSSIYGNTVTVAGVPLSISTTIWVFNEANNQYESYQQKTGAITSADTTTNINPGTATGSASNMIASGQAFFVKATAAGQTLSFRETAKASSSQPVAATLHNLMGKPKEFATAPRPFLRLKLIKDSINNDEIVIAFDNNASTKFVENEDAEDLGGNGALESLSAFSSDSVALAIDCTPFPGKQQEVIPLLVDATESGTYQLLNSQLMNMPALYVAWLKDAFTRDSVLLKTGASYSFNIDKSNPATFGNNRFSVVIRQNPAQAYQLLNFSAAKVPNVTQVQLVWNTVNEQNYTNFTVEHSTDGGKTFNILGGMQSTGAGTYSMLDKNPVNGQNLYRLEQVDVNNNVTYSAIVQVLFSDQDSGADKVRVYPNPATSMINVAIASDAKAAPPYQIMISTSSGRLIKQATSSQANWQSSIASLMPGTYIVKVINTNDSTLVGDSKFVKF